MEKIIREVGRYLPQVDLTYLVLIFNLSSILSMEPMFYVCSLLNESAIYLPFGCCQYDLVRSFMMLKSYWVSMTRLFMQ